MRRGGAPGGASGGVVKRPRRRRAADTCARGTFELMRAAVAARVPRVVWASTLDLFEAYPPGWAVQRDGGPRRAPSCVSWAVRRGALRARGGEGRLAALGGVRTAGRGWTSESWGRRYRMRAASYGDAVEAIRRALRYRPEGAGASDEPPNVADGSRGWAAPAHGWFVFHTQAGRERGFHWRGGARVVWVQGKARLQRGAHGARAAGTGGRDGEAGAGCAACLRGRTDQEGGDLRRERATGCGGDAAAE